MDNKQQDEQQSRMSRSQYRQQQRQTEQQPINEATEIQLINLIVAKQLLVSVMTKQWQKKRRA